jgi:F-type H+-transporting ATPase subunit gamma
MATLKDIQLKIAAVKKTQQITKAMNMVAASRLRGAQTSMEAFRPPRRSQKGACGSVHFRPGALRRIQ